jgi:hypothetical protein
MSSPDDNPRQHTTSTMVWPGVKRALCRGPRGSTEVVKARRPKPTDPLTDDELRRLLINKRKATRHLELRMLATIVRLQRELERARAEQNDFKARVGRQQQSDSFSLAKWDEAAAFLEWNKAARDSVTTKESLQSCHAKGCALHTAPESPMCMMHWLMLPSNARQAIGAECTAGGSAKQLSARYLVVLAGAVALLAVHEGMWSPRQAFTLVAQRTAVANHDGLDPTESDKLLREMGLQSIMEH